MTRVYILIIATIACGGCLYEAGTHGYIKRYRYGTSKYTLEMVVRNVISMNPNIHQDSVKGYYNDDTGYITMDIVEKEHTYTYTFHFYGGKEYWDTSRTSAISIAYAHNEKREGGSTGSGGIKWYDFKLKSELTEPFEREFIYKVDSVLRMKHTEE